MSSKQVEQAFAWIVKIGLWVIPVLPLYVSSSLLFPFITGKNFTFRIIVEIIFAFWAGLAVLNPAYRPRLSWLFRAVTLFVVIVFLADVLSPSSYRSFFSNYERMEGFMMLGHLYLYFLILSSAFKSRRDWLIFFHVSLAASFFVSLYAFFQRLGIYQSFQGGFRVDSTIGNPTYLAAYLWFHIWILAILLYEFWKKKWAVGVYGFLLLFELLIIYFTATRGTTLAFVGLTPLFFVLVVLLWPKIFARTKNGPLRNASWPLGRKIALGVLIFIIAVPAVLFLLRDSQFVRSNEGLERLTNYSLTSGTIQARFRIWNMAWQGVLERPILGWGQENFYLIFQKYYDPGLFGEEPWFDRAHNAVFDWLIHAGVLGLSAYLGIFGVLFWTIGRGMRRGILELWHGLVLAVIFIGYLFQNLFVFDNLNTYLLFFGTLAYTQFFSQSEEKKEEVPITRKEKIPLAIGITAAFVVTLFVAGYFLHIKPIRQGKALISALQVYALRAPMDQIIGAYQQALSYDSFGTTEVREQIGNAARAIPFDDRYTEKEKIRFLEFAIGEFKKETAHPAKDVKHVLFLGSLLNRLLDYNTSRLQETEGVLREAVSLSPTRQIPYLELAQFYLILGDVGRAAEEVKKAWELKKDVPEVAGRAWAVAVLADRDDIVQEIRKHRDIRQLDGGSVERVAASYQQVRNFAAAAEVYEYLVEKNPGNARYHAVYAALLAELGRGKEARAQAEEAIRLDPRGFGEEGKIFLKQLRQRGF